MAAYQIAAENVKGPINADDKAFLAASSLLEIVSSSSSATIYLYDLAAQLGFGSLARNIHNIGNGAPVFDMETRDGAGMLLVGRLNGRTSTSDPTNGAPITAFTTPRGLAHVAPSLDLLPEPSASDRLVIQVANIEALDRSYEYVPSFSSISLTLPVFPPSLLVIASSEPKEIVDLASLAYGINDKHVIHIFDHYAAGREVQRLALPRPPQPSPFEQALQASGYSYFDYHGPATAHTVVVISNGPLALLLKALVHSPALEGSFGVVVVRVLHPWNSEALFSVLPTSTERLYVVDEVSKNFFGSPYIFSETITSVLANDKFTALVPISLALTPAMVKAYMADPDSFLHRIHPTSQHIEVPVTASKKLAFWTSPSTPTSLLPSLISQTFERSSSTSVRHTTEYDIVSKPGGIALDRVSLSSTATFEMDNLPLSISIPLGSRNGTADMLVIGDQGLLKTHELLRVAKTGSSVLVFSSWTAEEFRSNLDPGVLDLIAKSNLRVYHIDLKQPSKAIYGARAEDVESALAYIAFLRIFLGKTGTRGALESLCKAAFGHLGMSYTQVTAIVWENLAEIDFMDATSEAPASGDNVQLATFSFNSVIQPESTDTAGESVGPVLGTNLDAAKHILFREAYQPESEPDKLGGLRPDLQEETFLVTCTVNRRLTPMTYDRNVFHLEFDTSGTGLKYAIGEALGIHGWNDEDDVLDFCSWYGIDPNKVVILPVPESGGKRMHCRTVFQALQQQVDIFGRPPKSFYAALAEHATSREDRMALLFIAAPEGSATFKKMGEVDTVTFADVLYHFKSARPGFEKLAELVGDIKPRHYSIASAMSAVGDRVDLLIVTVEWHTPSGSPRYGQCTRYLAGLKVGQKVTVSIKPSVMKLPPDDMQPIIMAGLGTGAAPFRAFMQHRAMLAAENKPAGPLVYYFGSRHRHEEYLYGEEIEAFLASSVLTKAGLAFSRDQKKKVYIQHKMQEDASGLVRMLREDKGVFYLCGPTWPVPDVYATLVGAMVGAGVSEEAAGEYLEGLKEEERYVLEVY